MMLKHIWEVLERPFYDTFLTVHMNVAPKSSTNFDTTHKSCIKISTNPIFIASLASVHFHFMLLLILCNDYLLLCENGKQTSIYLSISVIPLNVTTCQETSWTNGI